MPKSARFAIGLALWWTPAWAATLQSLSLNDLVSKSTAIVQGQVTGSSAAFSGSVIYTHYKVSVIQQWKGAAQQTIDVMVPGGTANHIRHTYPGTPQLTAGKQYVLFLWTSSKGATYTLGLTQGVFTLGRDASGTAMASQMPTTETMLSSGTGQVVVNPPINVPMAQLVSTITAGAK